jgi:hypothetical protein
LHWVVSAQVVLKPRWKRRLERHGGGGTGSGRAGETLRDLTGRSQDVVNHLKHCGSICIACFDLVKFIPQSVFLCFLRFLELTVIRRIL